jgi:hypothetical protein
MTPDPDSFDLGGLLGGAFTHTSGFENTELGRAARAARADAKKPAPGKPKPLPTIRGKRIDGVLYVCAEDVADALELQTPVAAKRLIDKLRKQS